MSTLENDPAKQIERLAARRVKCLESLAKHESDLLRILVSGPADSKDVHIMLAIVAFTLGSLEHARADGTLPMPQPSTPA